MACLPDALVRASAISVCHRPPACRQTTGTETVGKQDGMVDPHLERLSKAPSAFGLLRPRLTTDLNDPHSPRLVLAVGPPGTGKTTLLTQWAAQCSGHVAWYRSSRRDAKQESMFLCFAIAVARAIERRTCRLFPRLGTGRRAAGTSTVFCRGRFPSLGRYRRGG